MLCKKNLFLALLFFSANYVYSQNRLFSVKIDLVAADYSNVKPVPKTKFYGVATVSNIQDTSLSFYILSCGWPRKNWVSMDDSISYEHIGCDNNFPDRITLQPNQSIKFKVVINNRHVQWNGSNPIQMGFIYFKTEKELSDRSMAQKSIPDSKVFWSNPFFFDDVRITYKVE